MSTINELRAWDRLAVEARLSIGNSHRQRGRRTAQGCAWSLKDAEHAG